MKSAAVIPLAQPGYELMLKSLLLKLLTLLLPYCSKSSEQPQLQSEHTQKIKGVLEYIGLHYTENISIESLASSAISANTISCAFLRNMSECHA